MDEPKLKAQAKTFVRAPRERVYDAFATANGLNGWFTKGAEVDARPGGKMLFRFENWGPEHNINESFPGKVVEAKRVAILVKFYLEHGLVYDSAGH